MEVRVDYYLGQILRQILFGYSYALQLALQTNPGAYLAFFPGCFKCYPISIDGKTFYDIVQHIKESHSIVEIKKNHTV